MAPRSKQTYRLDALAGLELYNVTAQVVSYRGRGAVRIVEDVDAEAADDDSAMAIIAGSEFRDGIIETEISGAPVPGAAEGMRGFVGIAFRVQPKGKRYECFYLRPTNGRADDQLRRNHATQYISFPEYPWFRLRDETPGVYESYVDLVPGAWTRIRIEVSGSHARLYVGGADQACLVVNDLKLGEQSGQIGLWIGAGTEAHFSEVVLQ